MSIETLTILLPAFIAGLLVCATHVPLGIEVLKRGIIFIDLAIAQIAALGVIVAGLAMHDLPFYAEQLCALTFALLGALFFQYVEKTIPKQQEAIIGASFIITSSLAILLVANNPHGGEEIEAMLAGQILWVDWKQIITAFIIYILVLALWFRSKGKQWFYYLFAVTVTVSVQLIGVYLVFACLIFPALGTLRCKHKRLLKAYILSAISLIIGLLISSLTDYPTGPVLVCILAVSSILSYRLLTSKLMIR